MEQIENPLEQFLNKKIDRAEEYRKIIEGMMGNYFAYHYAEGTLLGILEFIEKNNDISEAQIQAINNIKNKPNKKNDR